MHSILLYNYDWLQPGFTIYENVKQKRRKKDSLIEPVLCWKKKLSPFFSFLSLWCLKKKLKIGEINPGKFKFRWAKFLFFSFILERSLGSIEFPRHFWPLILIPTLKLKTCQTIWAHKTSRLLYFFGNRKKENQLKSMSDNVLIRTCHVISPLHSFHYYLNKNFLHCVIK